MSIANKARRTSPPLTEPLTITLTGSDLEHLNAFREAKHALYNKPVDGYTNKKLDELKVQRREAATHLQDQPAHIGGRVGHPELA